jgi:hypothetical protein
LWLGIQNGISSDRSTSARPDTAKKCDEIVTNSLLQSHDVSVWVHTLRMCIGTWLMLSVLLIVWNWDYLSHEVNHIHININRYDSHDSDGCSYFSSSFCVRERQDIEKLKGVTPFIPKFMITRLMLNCKLKQFNLHLSILSFFFFNSGMSHFHILIFSYEGERVMDWITGQNIRTLFQWNISSNDCESDRKNCNSYHSFHSRITLMSHDLGNQDRYQFRGFEKLQRWITKILFPINVTR